MVILYSTHCPKCNIIEKKLKEKNIDYIENNNTDEMIAKGFMEVPMLEIDGVIMNFGKAIKWIGEQ